MDDQILKIIYGVISFLAVAVSCMLGFFFRRTVTDSDAKFSKFEAKMDTLNTRVFDSVEKLNLKLEQLGNEVYLIKGLLSSRDFRQRD